MHANSRYEASFWTVNVVGAPLGGLLVSALGAPASMAAHALTCLASAAGIRRITRPEPEPPALVSTGWLHDVTSGWRCIWAAPTYGSSGCTKRSSHGFYRACRLGVRLGSGSDGRVSTQALF